MLKNIDLNKFRYFERVFAHQGLSKAAIDLFVSASAVTQSIRALEKELGVQLFLRVGKKYLPTHEAKKLHRSLLPALETLESCVEEIRQEKQLLHGTLRLGTPPEFGVRHVMELVKEFKGLHPRVEIQIDFQGTTALLKLLETTRLDLAFVDDSSVARKNFASIHFAPITQELLVMACSLEYWNQHLRGRKLTIQLLAGLDHVPYHPGEEGTTKWYRHHFGKVPKFKTALYVDNVRGVAQAIRLGFGVGVVPFPLIEADVQAKRVKVIEASPKEFLAPMALAQLYARVPSRLERAFSEFALKYLANR